MILDGWWWSAAVGEPGELSTVQGVRAPPLEANVDQLVRQLRGSAAGLSVRSAEDIANTLGAVGERFQGDLLDDSAALVSSESGLSLPMATRVVAGMAEGWSKAALNALLHSEFDDPRVLDSFTEGQGATGRQVRAYGRGFTVHVGSGSVPGVSVSSLIRGLMVKCPSLVKPGLGDVALTVAFLRALAEEDEELASSAAALYWSGGSPEAASSEETLFQDADQVVVYGGTEAVDRIGGITVGHTPLVVHPHRIGVIVAGRGGEGDTVADAVCMFDQRGCVSPQIVLYLGDEAEAADWAGSLAAEFSRLEGVLPPGKGSAEARSAVHQLRGAFELRHAAGEPVRVIYRVDESWSLLVAPLEDVRPIGMRTLWVVPTATTSALQESLAALGPVLQSVGLTGELDMSAVVGQASAAGASRIVPVEALAFPEPDWLHDGQGPLRELVRWAEWRGPP